MSNEITLDEAVNRLTEVGIITDGTYWKENAIEGIEVDFYSVQWLIIKIYDYCLATKSCPDGTSETSLQFYNCFVHAVEALEVDVLGTIDTIDYWLNGKTNPETGNQFYDGIWVGKLIIKSADTIDNLERNTSEDIQYLYEKNIIVEDELDRLSEVAVFGNTEALNEQDKFDIQEVIIRFSDYYLNYTSSISNSTESAYVFQRAVHNMYTLGVSNTKEYWTGGGDYLGNDVATLFNRMVISLKSKPSNQNNNVDYLYRAGIIDSPDYWKSLAQQGRTVWWEDAQLLIMKLADACNGFAIYEEAEDYTGAVNYLQNVVKAIDTTDYWLQEPNPPDDYSYNGEYIANIIQRTVVHLQGYSTNESDTALKSIDYFYAIGLINNPDLWISWFEDDSDGIDVGDVRTLMTRACNYYLGTNYSDTDEGDFTTVLNYLVELGVFETPDYWTSHAPGDVYSDEYVKRFINRMAIVIQNKGDQAAIDKLINEYNVSVFGERYYITPTTSENIDYLASLGIINSPDYWKQVAVESIEADITDTQSLFVKISDFYYETNTYGNSNAFEQAVNNMVMLGCINSPDYWLYRTENFYDGLYISYFIDRAADAIRLKLNGSGYSGSRIPEEIAFTEKIGVINTKDYWLQNAQPGKTCSKEYTILLLNRMAQALGSGSDRYNSNIYFLQEKGVLGDPSYWTDGSSTTGGPGTMCAQGWADGQYVETVIKNFYRIYREENNITDPEYITLPDGTVVQEFVPDITEIHKSLGIYVPTYQATKLYDYYNRWRRMEYIDHLTTTRAYVFFTKPKLNFSRSNLSKDLFFSNMSETIQGRNMLKNLTYDTTDTDPIPRSTRGIIKLLTNTAENFDTSDLSIRSDITVETRTGYKYSLPGSEVDTVTNGNFTINYTELGDMSITLTHKAWLDYIIYVRRGKFVPSDTARYQRYMDYSSSVYFFTVAEDGMTIKYFAKYTGVYPINVPYSGFSWSKGESSATKLSIQYAYSFREDMSPEIIEEFNRLFGAAYDPPIDRSNDTWKSSVGIYRVFPKGDGTMIKHYINELRDSKFFYDGTAKLIFY